MPDSIACAAEAKEASDEAIAFVPHRLPGVTDPQLRVPLAQGEPISRTGDPTSLQPFA